MRDDGTAWTLTASVRVHAGGQWTGDAILDTGSSLMVAPVSAKGATSLGQSSENFSVGTAINFDLVKAAVRYSDTCTETDSTVAALEGRVVEFGPDGGLWGVLPSDTSTRFPGSNLPMQLGRTWMAVDMNAQRPSLRFTNADPDAAAAVLVPGVEISSAWPAFRVNLFGLVVYDSQGTRVVVPRSRVPRTMIIDTGTSRAFALQSLRTGRGSFIPQTQTMTVTGVDIEVSDTDSRRRVITTGGPFSLEAFEAALPRAGMADETDLVFGAPSIARTGPIHFQFDWSRPPSTAFRAVHWPRTAAAQ